MPYMVKPKTSGGFGMLTVLAADSREAFEAARGMIDRGVEEVEVLDDDGRSCDLSELAPVAAKIDA